MSVIIRGAKNAFRNSIRTLAVTLILAISIGLALVMLLSYRSVDKRITSVQSSIGNLITVSPAGSRGFEGGGEPLTEIQLAEVSNLEHVTGVNKVLEVRLTTDTNTSLQSAIEPGTLGNRRNSTNGSGSTNSNTITMRAPADMPVGNFKMPIMVTGTNNTSDVTSAGATLTSGELFDGNADENVAIIGSAVATKNNLGLGSTFTVYGTDITVKGIYEASSNQFANGSVYMPIKAVQRLSSQAGEVSAATIQVDSVNSLDATYAAVKEKLGSTADVTSTADSAKNAIEPLKNIKNISLYSLIGSLIAGAIIALLTMIMIVRERRREIGVLKAIGASNLNVMVQFTSESMVLTFLGSLVGMILGVFLSNPVLNALVSSNSNSAGTASNIVTSGGPGGLGGPGGAVMQVGRGVGAMVRTGSPAIKNALTDLQATVGLDIILYGLLAAFVIAILGSALPAWLIAKVRPAEVMRSE